MYEDHAGHASGIPNRRREDLTRMRQGRRERPNRDDLLGNQLMPGIQKEGEQVFLLLVANLNGLGDHIIIAERGTFSFKERGQL